MSGPFLPCLVSTRRPICCVAQQMTTFTSAGCYRQVNQVKFSKDGKLFFRTIASGGVEVTFLTSHVDRQGQHLSHFPQLKYPTKPTILSSLLSHQSFSHQSFASGLAVSHSVTCVEGQRKRLSCQSCSEQIFQSSVHFAGVQLP